MGIERRRGGGCFFHLSRAGNDFIPRLWEYDGRVLAVGGGDGTFMILSVTAEERAVIFCPLTSKVTFFEKFLSV